MTLYADCYHVPTDCCMFLGLETLFNLQVLQETVGVKYLFDL